MDKINKIIKESIRRVLLEDDELKRQEIEDSWDNFDLNNFQEFGDRRYRLNRLDSLNKYDIRSLKPEYPYQTEQDLENYYFDTGLDLKTESQLNRIIKESVKKIIFERQGLKSQKLFDIIKQHGGVKSNRGIFDLHNMSDSDVLDVVDYRGLREFENNKPKVNASDEIDYIPLKDGYYIIALCRGCRFDRVRMPDRKREPGDFEDLYQKTSNRQRNKQNTFHWLDREAEDVFKNPYFRAGEGGWTPSRKTEVMNTLRNRKK